MKYKQLDHFVLLTSDLQACLNFYVNILGLEHLVLDGHHSLKVGSQKINIHTRKGEFEPCAKNPEYGSADFCLIVDGDIKACKKEVEVRGGTIEFGPVPRNGALGPMQSLYLRDPDGNLIELASYDIPNFSDVKILSCR